MLVVLVKSKHCHRCTCELELQSQLERGNHKLLPLPHLLTWHGPPPDKFGFLLPIVSYLEIVPRFETHSCYSHKGNFKIIFELRKLPPTVRELEQVLWLISLLSWVSVHHPGKPRRAFTARGRAKNTLHTVLAVLMLYRFMTSKKEGLLEREVWMFLLHYRGTKVFQPLKKKKAQKAF